MAPILPPGFSSFDHTYGALLIGALISILLYGVTLSQTYIFYSRYPHESRRNKLIVGCLWTLDTIHTSLTFEALYHYFIRDSGNLIALSKSDWSILSGVLINRLIALVAQSYFACMTFRLCPPRYKMWLGCTTGFFVVVHALYGIAFVVLCFYWDGDYGKLETANNYAGTPAVSVGVVAETMIVAALCVFLKGKETGFESTKKIIRIIIIYAINRCVLTSACLILEVALVEVRPFYSIAIELIVGKLYAASVLSTLNSRPVEQATLSLPTKRITVELRTTVQSECTWNAEETFYRPGHSNIDGHLRSSSDPRSPFSPSKELAPNGGDRC